MPLQSGRYFKNVGSLDMTYECFEVTNVGKIAHVQMSRGENLNTMVPSFWKELPEIINAISIPPSNIP